MVHKGSYASQGDVAAGFSVHALQRSREILADLALYGEAQHNMRLFEVKRFSTLLDQHLI